MIRYKTLRPAVAGALLAVVFATTADAVTHPRHDRQEAGPSAEVPFLDDLSFGPAEEDPAPPLRRGPGLAVPVGNRFGAPSGPVAMPEVALRAYRAAERQTAGSLPGCHVSWPLVAAIGRVESNHARGGQVDAAGTTITPILGPQLSGNGFAAIADTDDGAFDGDITWDRAVGPMQFIPSTWRRVGIDGNADGVASPHNLFDAASSAAAYLCAHGRDLSDPDQLRAAVFGYNHSLSYVDMVLSWQRAYAAGVALMTAQPLRAPHGSAATPRDQPATSRPRPPQEPRPADPPDSTTPAPPPEQPAPPTDECLLDLADLGVTPDALRGITTQVACEDALIRLGPLRVGGLPRLPIPGLLG